jgi:predicted MPP superfamily phosphohydrolase
MSIIVKNRMEFMAMSKFLKVSSALVAGMVFLLGYSLHQHRNPRMVNRRVSGAPSHLRIVFLSDFHESGLFGRRHWKKLFRRINLLRFDVIILGGDYLAGTRRGGNLRKLPILTKQLKMLRANLKIAVLGNHDHYDGWNEIRIDLEKIGFHVLVNQKIDFGDFTFIGVDDCIESFAVLPTGITPERYNVLISHSPEYFTEILKRNHGLFKLAFAGHTHGGQFKLLCWTPFFPENTGICYLQTRREENGTTVLTGNGLGGTVPLRIGVPTEVLVAELDV